MFSNIQNSNPNFTGYYSCKLNKLSGDSQNLAKAGAETMKNAVEMLEKLQKIDCGKYTITNYDKPKAIKPVLSAKSDIAEVKMSPYLDGFHLSISNKINNDGVDIVSVWGGDTVEFESSNFPLKPSEFKELSGHILDSVDSLIKKYMPVFIK